MKGISEFFVFHSILIYPDMRYEIYHSQSQWKSICFDKFIVCINDILMALKTCSSFNGFYKMLRIVVCMKSDEISPQ